MQERLLLTNERIFRCPIHGLFTRIAGGYGAEPTDVNCPCLRVQLGPLQLEKFCNLVSPIEGSGRGPLTAEVRRF